MKFLENISEGTKQGIIAAVSIVVTAISIIGGVTAFYITDNLAEQETHRACIAAGKSVVVDEVDDTEFYVCK